jgi:hypothetical protein
LLGQLEGDHRGNHVKEGFHGLLLEVGNELVSCSFAVQHGGVPDEIEVLVVLMFVVGGKRLRIVAGSTRSSLACLMFLFPSLDSCR